MATSSKLRAAPNHFSPKAATFASLSRMTRVPNRFSISDRTGESAHPGKFGDSRIIPVRMSMIPGTPMPMPSNVAKSLYFAVKCWTASHISLMTWSRPSVTRVPKLIFSNKEPCSSTAAMRRLVPPRSTPIEKLGMFANQSIIRDFRLPICCVRFKRSEGKWPVTLHFWHLGQ